MFLGIFLATYGAVFLAEIVGDKLLYTTGILAARYKTVPIMVGMAFAFMIKMGVAVLVGEQIKRLPLADRLRHGGQFYRRGHRGMAQR